MQDLNIHLLLIMILFSIWFRHIILKLLNPTTELKFDHPNTTRPAMTSQCKVHYIILSHHPPTILD